VKVELLVFGVVRRSKLGFSSIADLTQLHALSHQPQIDWIINAHHVIFQRFIGCTALIRTGPGSWK